MRPSAPTTYGMDRQLRRTLIVSWCPRILALQTNPNQSDLTLKELLDWLTMTNFRSMLQDNLAKRTPGTGKAFVTSETFGSWLRKGFRVLWAHGMREAGIRSSLSRNALMRSSSWGWQDDTLVRFVGSGLSPATLTLDMQVDCSRVSARTIPSRGAIWRQLH